MILRVLFVLMMVSMSLSATINELNERACNNGNGDACIKSAMDYIFTNNDYVTSTELFQKSCVYGNAEGCRWYGDRLNKGIGVKKDYAKAAKFYKKSCDGGDTAGCRALSFLYRDGKGVPKNSKIRISLLTKGCYENGDLLTIMISCDILGNIYLANGMEEKSVKTFKRACKFGVKDACANLSVQYFIGKGVNQNYKEAHKYAKQSCDPDALFGCSLLKIISYFGAEEVGKNPVKIMDILTNKCERGNKEACFLTMQLESILENSKEISKLLSN